MATEKQRFSITVDDSLYRKIEDFRFEKRIKSQSKAVNELMKIGFNALTGKDINLGPSLSSFELGIIEKYNALDKHGKEIIDFILKKEYERCSASQPYTKIVDSKAREDYSMVAENTISYMSDNVSSYESELNAAHERTDVEVTDEMKKCDDDIMDGDDF